jgi:hypothetical protein
VFLSRLDKLKKGVPMAEETRKERRLFQECLPDEALDHLRAARTEVRKSIEALFPQEFNARRRAARREVLLAVRSVIDAALERLETNKA